MRFETWRRAHRCDVCGSRYSLFCLDCHLSLPTVDEVRRLRRAKENS
jgi:hypothetical protein